MITLAIVGLFLDCVEGCRQRDLTEQEMKKFNDLVKVCMITEANNTIQRIKEQMTASANMGEEIEKAKQIRENMLSAYSKIENGNDDIVVEMLYDQIMATKYELLETIYQAENNKGDSITPESR